MVYTVKSKQLPLMISPRTKSSPHLVLNDVDCANAATMNSMLPAMVRQFDNNNNNDNNDRLTAFDPGQPG